MYTCSRVPSAEWDSYSWNMVWAGGPGCGPVCPAGSGYTTLPARQMEQGGRKAGAGQEEAGINFIVFGGAEPIPHPLIWEAYC